MDSIISSGRLSRQLYRRGTHRLLGSRFLGSFAAFLTVLLLIRIGVNFFLVIDLTFRNSSLDSLQIGSAHFVLLSAYAVWVGSLSSLRVGLALPRICFVALAPYGKRFRWNFIRQIAFLRPMNIASLLIWLLTMLLFSIVCRTWHEIVARGLIALLATSIGVISVTALASRFVLGRSEMQIVEILFLLFLVALNPDIGSFHNRVSIFFGGTYWSFSGIWEVGSAVGLIILLALLVLLVVGALSAANKLFARQIALSPIERWYWRLLRVRSWVLLYAVVAPVLISSTIAPAVKRWSMVLAILFGVATYAYFVAHCENELSEKWRCSLSDRGNLRLLARPLLTHAVLVAIPVVAYILLR
jgi:hypothetical protein